MAGGGTRVAVIGGWVVGCAVAHALARRGVETEARHRSREGWREFVERAARL
jgi:NADPH-dependent 2,4-dienoyl-CoA reductase/sulfur reductase-like enzyme